jgi:hypothetical protein
MSLLYKLVKFIFDLLHVKKNYLKFKYSLLKNSKISKNNNNEKYTSFEFISFTWIANNRKFLHTIRKYCNVFTFDVQNIQSALYIRNVSSIRDFTCNFYHSNAD